MMLDHVVVSGPDLRRYSHGQQYTIIHTWRCCVSGGRGVGLECIDVVCQNIDDVSAYGVSRRAENVGDNRTLSYCVYIHCTTVAPIGPILFNERKLCLCTCTTHFSRTLHIAQNCMILRTNFQKFSGPPVWEGMTVQCIRVCRGRAPNWHFFLAIHRTWCIPPILKFCLRYWSYSCDNWQWILIVLIRR